MSRIVFRLDDITPNMNWNNFYRIKKIFDQYQLRPLLGIVPDNRDEMLNVSDVRTDFWELLHSLEKEGWSLSQHGFQHVYETKNSGILKANPFSEFAGLSLEIQEHKIRKGKQILEEHGIYTTIFMPPGHTFDRNTINALKKNGFQYITDGYARQNYMIDGIMMIPCRQSDVWQAKGYDTVCLHINSMKAADFDRLEQYIAEHRRDFMDYSVCLAQKAGNRNLFVIAQEWKYRLERTVKRYFAEHDTMQQYMQKSYHTNKVIRIYKRLLYMPYLIWITIKNGRK